MNAERTPSSDSFLPSAAVENFAASHESGHSPTWWVLACLTAIVLGVIPALLINHYRNAPAQQAQQMVPAPAPQPTPPTPAVAPASASSDTPPATPPTVPMIEMDEDKPDPGHTTDHVRHPLPHPPKRPPPCDVYLHPHGCPH